MIEERGSFIIYTTKKESGCGFQWNYSFVYWTNKKGRCEILRDYFDLGKIRYYASTKKGRGVYRIAGNELMPFCRIVYPHLTYLKIPCGLMMDFRNTYPASGTPSKDVINKRIRLSNEMIKYQQEYGNSNERKSRKAHPLSFVD